MPINLPAEKTNQILQKRELLRAANRPAAKLTAIQSMAMQITELNPDSQASQDQIIRLAESIGLLADEAVNNLNQVINSLNERD